MFEKESSKGQVVLKQTIQQILEIFESNLVNPSSITTYEMNKRAKRARENNGYNELEILGYEFTQRFEIKLKNLENYFLNVRGVKAYLCLGKNIRPLHFYH